MGNLWLKIKIWTKSILFGALFLYALLFILNNSGQPVKFWYWFKHEYETSMLVLIVVTFLAGVLCAILVRTTFKTLRQVRELRERSRIDRLEREHAEMKAKAAMLQTRTSASSASSNSSTTASSIPPSEDMPA
jgi:uncharacterized membrane protein YciS (DUF1049 family)